IVTNYVTNAVLHGQPPIRIVSTATPAGIEVRVVDSGPGVPADFVDDLFGRFHRAPGTTSPGSGLGLYIVRGLARAMGGDAWYEHAAAGGACFAFRLPAPAD